MLNSNFDVDQAAIEAHVNAPVSAPQLTLPRFNCWEGKPKLLMETRTAQLHSKS